MYFLSDITVFEVLTSLKQDKNVCVLHCNELGVHRVLIHISKCLSKTSESALVSFVLCFTDCADRHNKGHCLV